MRLENLTSNLNVSAAQVLLAASKRLQHTSPAEDLRAKPLFGRSQSQDSFEELFDCDVSEPERTLTAPDPVR